MPPLFMGGKCATPHGLEVMQKWGNLNTKPTLFGKRSEKMENQMGAELVFISVMWRMLLLEIRGNSTRTLAPGRSQVNLFRTQKREHSRKPDEVYLIIEKCSNGPFLEIFARETRENWTLWGDQANTEYEPDWPIYANHTVSQLSLKWG